MKRGFNRFLYKKKGLLPLKTIIYFLIAVAVILVFGWAVVQAAERIFG